jgi:hypothetical protein
MVQIGVLAVCAVIFAVILFTMVLKKDDTAATTDPAASATSTGAAPTTSTPTTSAPATDPAASAAPSAAAPVTPPAGSSAAGDAADGLLPSKGLPEDVLVAFAKNETIALLVVDPKGVSDNQVKSFTETLNARDDVEVFTVPVDKIAKYARITAGVSVSRTPALVVIRPRKLTGSVPTASVSYGFRGPRSINQAVDDALYDGKQVPSYP